MEDNFLIRPSSKEVFIGADQMAHHNDVKNQHRRTNNNDDGLKYLPKMHNVYRLSSKERSEPDLYGNQNRLTIYLLKRNMYIFMYQSCTKIQYLCNR